MVSLYLIGYLYLGTCTPLKWLHTHSSGFGFKRILKKCLDNFCTEIRLPMLISIQKTYNHGSNMICVNLDAPVLLIANCAILMEYRFPSTNSQSNTMKPYLYFKIFVQRYVNLCLSPYKYCTSMVST